MSNNKQIPIPKGALTISEIIEILKTLPQDAYLLDEHACEYSGGRVDFIFKESFGVCDKPQIMVFKNRDSYEYDEMESFSEDDFIVLEDLEEGEHEGCEYTLPFKAVRLQ